MKTTLELPDALVKQVKLHAVREGRKLKDTVAELLRKGLAAAKKEDPRLESANVGTHKKSGLPLIKCKHAASARDELTPERVAEILITQEANWQYDAGR